MIPVHYVSGVCRKGLLLISVMVLKMLVYYDLFNTVEKLAD
jgi:hypothetical protein